MGIQEGEDQENWVMETKQVEGEASSGPREMAGAYPSNQGGRLGGRDASR